MRFFPRLSLVAGLGLVAFLLLVSPAMAQDASDALTQAALCKRILLGIAAPAEFPFSEFANRYVGPLAIIIGAVNFAVSTPFYSVGRLLQGFLLEPALLFFGHHRRAYGTVFDSLSKKPVDLALVRLIDVSTNRIVRTRVTDKLGRFSFFVSPGRYRFLVDKKGYVFPSAFLKGETYDASYGPIITGEDIQQNKTGVIDVNIPVDGPEDRVSPAAAIRRHVRRGIHTFLAYFGIILSAVVVVFAWSWQAWALLIVHILLFMIFIRLSARSYGRPWGRVYDHGTQSSLGRSVVRILDNRFNRVLETVVTDQTGEYGFLVGTSTYRLEALRPGYINYEGEVFTPKRRPAVVSKNIPLRKMDGVAYS
jgi:hypothetical protein